MTISGIVIQQHDGTILFSNVREYLSPDKALLAAKAFKNHISLNDDSFISKGSTTHLTGSIVVLNMYRVHYMILNDIFILAISQANDNPYEGSVYLVRVKRVLWTASKELLVHNIMKKYTEVYFALERVLFGEDGVDVLTQRINEMQPHFTQSTQPTTQNLIAPPSFITGSQNTPQPVNIFGRIIDNNNNSNSNSNNNNNIIPPTLTSSTTNTPSTTPISTTPSSTSPTSNLINNSNSNSNSNLTSSQVSISSTSSLSSNNLLNSSNGLIVDNNLDYQQHQLNIISSLENIQIPSKVFTQPDTLPKIDKHIYDPPQTVKWGSTSVQSTTATSTRVTNRIMFTLRHPNAAQNSKDENEGGSGGSGSSSGTNGMNHSVGNSASKDTTPISSPLASSFNSLLDVSSSSDFNSDIASPDKQSPENIAQSSSPPTNNADELVPPTGEPRRKFSLSMGTFKSNSVAPQATSATPNSNNNSSKPDLETSSATQPTPPPSVPIPANVKSKMNFLNF